MSEHSTEERRRFGRNTVDPHAGCNPTITERRTYQFGASQWRPWYQNAAARSAEHATCPRCGHPLYHDSEGEYCPNCGPVEPK